MKPVHEFLIVSIALALAGTGILIASTETEYNPVYGFTDQSCTYNLKFFQSIEKMEAFSRADNGWKHNSYMEFLKSQQCIEVVRAVGTRPEGEGEEEEGTNPGGGGGVGGGQPPSSGAASLEPPGENSSQSEQEDYVDDIHECWTDGMNASELSWSQLDQNLKDLPVGSMGARGRTSGNLYIDYLEILSTAGSTVNVNHLTIIVEMHEDVHGTQDLTDLKYMSNRPRLEIEAYAGSYLNYEAIQGAPPPAPYLTIDDWDAYLGDNRHSRRKAWNRAVEIYDPLEKIQIGGGTLNSTQRTKYKKNRNILQSMWSDFFNTEVDKLNTAAYDKDEKTHLPCD